MLFSNRIVECFQTEHYRVLEFASEYKLTQSVRHFAQDDGKQHNASSLGFYAKIISSTTGY